MLSLNISILGNGMNFLILQARGGDAARGAAIAELVKYLKDFMNDSEAW